MPSSERTGSVQRRQPLDRRARRELLGPLEVDQAAVHAVADRPPEVLLDQPRRRSLQRHPLVHVAHRLGDARHHQRGQGLGLRRGGLGVADAQLDGAEGEVGPDRPPDLRELDDRVGP